MRVGDNQFLRVNETKKKGSVDIFCYCLVINLELLNQIEVNHHIGIR
jgi:hypothetical protein